MAEGMHNLPRFAVVFFMPATLRRLFTRCTAYCVTRIARRVLLLECAAQHNARGADRLSILARVLRRAAHDIFNVSHRARDTSRAARQIHRALTCVRRKTVRRKKSITKF